MQDKKSLFVFTVSTLTLISISMIYGSSMYYMITEAINELSKAYPLNIKIFFFGGTLFLSILFTIFEFFFSCYLILKIQDSIGLNLINRKFLKLMLG